MTPIFLVTLNGKKKPAGFLWPSKISRGYESEIVQPEIFCCLLCKVKPTLQCLVKSSSVTLLQICLN